MAGKLAINAGKRGRTSVPTPSASPSFALGSRPTTLRQAAVPRIKPMLQERQYGKLPATEGVGSGQTGLTSRS